MATINNIILDINKGPNTSTVTVSYEVCFTPCEIKAGIYFSDKAKICGSDPGMDDFLIFMGGTYCYKATKECQKRVYKRTVKNSTLDEDKDWFWIKFRDELYARACVAPFQATGDCENSPIVTGYF